MFIPLAWFNGSRYNKIHMKNYFRSWIGVICFLSVLGPNAAAQDQSGKKSMFDPIKGQMLSVAEENIALAKQNQRLRVQLIGFQLEVEKNEKVIKDLDSGYIYKDRYLREEEQVSFDESMDEEESKSSALIKEAQDLFLSGQYMDLDEGQRLRELQLYDLQYLKQELELDLQDKQAQHQKIEEQKRLELQAAESEVQESVMEEENMRRKVAEAEKGILANPRNIDLLKIENETLRKKINQLRNFISQ